VGFGQIKQLCFAYDGQINRQARARANLCLCASSIYAWTSILPEQNPRTYT